ncbi:NADPH dependent diflavin oxidoreductase-like protein 1 [Trichodelitschia bisporula]|uniref:NADPH-dependent diflavin oxidoreductase 1 n=1 Tax=Trichodelitschia bisporula TaxID=703511 RepID=A0A6G1HXX4_9PEZI|nr:NADPH dependent diflavin oxidoreductase-like protein 1 [Trichodelitschia bisporula]
MASTVLPPRSALVVYGSETGNAQDVADEIGRVCSRLRFTTTVADFNSISLRQLLQHQIVIFAISTTGQGDLPANAQFFWKSLRSVRLPPTCLLTLRFASFGLGDSSYPKFNWAHRKLYNRVMQLGAQPICDRGEADDQHPEGVDGAFVPWLVQLRRRLLEEFTLPDGVEPIPDDVLLEPKWILDFADCDEQCVPVCDGTSETENVGKPADPTLPPTELLQIDDGIAATVLTNDRITPATHWQDVRHLTLKLAENRQYSPGDILAIHPKNFPQDVEQFIELMDWTSVADKALKFTPTGLDVDLATYPQPPKPPLGRDSSLTLRALLTNYLDIMSIPRRSFFSLLQHYTTDPFHLERLREFTNPEYIDELYDYTTRPRRSILEVFTEFTSSRIPWQRACDVLPAMRSRQFSIASGGHLKTLIRPDTTTLTKVELLIAIVRYKTVIKRTRQGVATRYIASLAPGQEITVTILKGGIRVKDADMVRPVVLIGPGTGVAPLRALIYERAAWRSERGVNVDGKETELLFFGCRNEDADFFFSDEWKALEGRGLLVFAAFSRDQRRKVYVQDLVREEGSRVWDAIGKDCGMVVVCGSSGKMPLAVREALVEVFQKQGQMARFAAEEYLIRLEKEGRYRQETW